MKSKRDYLRKGSHFSWLYLSRLAALKEYAFMKALGDHGLPVPKVGCPCNWFRRIALGNPKPCAINVAWVPLAACIATHRLCVCVCGLNACGERCGSSWLNQHGKFTMQGPPHLSWLCRRLTTTGTRC